MKRRRGRKPYRGDWCPDKSSVRSLKRAVHTMPNDQVAEPHTRNPKQEASYILLGRR
jgi:hypothetical protein